MSGGDGLRRIAAAIEGSGGHSTWPVVRPSKLQGQPVPPRNWCVDGWIPDKVVTLLSGDGGTGKSLLAMQLATSCAMGLPFMGIEVARRRVLYLAAEDDLDELHRRQADINDNIGIEFSELDDQLYWRGVSGDEALLVRADGKSGRTLKPTATYENMRNFCRGQGIQLVIVDTVADTFGGLEIDRQQVTKYVRYLEAIARLTDGAVVALVHPGVAGLANGSGISGSTAWRNSARSLIYMRRPTAEEADGANARDIRIIERLKGNFAAAGAELRVEWWRGSFSLVDRATDATQAVDVIASHVRVMTAIRRALRQGQMLSMSKNSSNYAPKVLRPYRELTGLKAVHLEEAISALLEQGQLRFATVGRAGHEKRCIALPDDGAIAVPRADHEVE